MGAIMRQIKASLLITTWNSKMNREYDDISFSSWMFEQMEIFEITPKDLVKWGDITYDQIHYTLNKTKRYPQIQTIKRICLAFASITPKDYYEYYYEALLITGQIDLFPQNKLHEIKDRQ